MNQVCPFMSTPDESVKCIMGKCKLWSTNGYDCSFNSIDKEIHSISHDTHEMNE